MTRPSYPGEGRLFSGVADGEGVLDLNKGFPVFPGVPRKKAVAVAVIDDENYIGSLHDGFDGCFIRTVRPPGHTFDVSSDHCHSCGTGRFHEGDTPFDLPVDVVPAAPIPFMLVPAVTMRVFAFFPARASAVSPLSCSA